MDIQDKAVTYTCQLQIGKMVTGKNDIFYHFCV